MSIDN